MAGIPILGGKPKAPSASGELSAHRIVVQFPDDHTIGDSEAPLTVEIVGVTAEQIWVVMMHLSRVVFMTLAQRDSIARAAEAEAMAVRAGLAAEQGKVS